MSEDFYVRYYIGHKGKFGHEFLEFELRPDGQVQELLCHSIQSPCCVYEPVHPLSTKQGIPALLEFLCSISALTTIGFDY